MLVYITVPCLEGKNDSVCVHAVGLGSFCAWCLMRFLYTGTRVIIDVAPAGINSDRHVQKVISED